MAELTERTEAAKQSDIRVDKAAWMNDQLATRLHQYDGDDAGVAPAKDARAEGEYPKPKAAKAAKPADVQP